jgi:hypothetical protein
MYKSIHSHPSATDYSEILITQKYTIVGNEEM